MGFDVAHTEKPKPEYLLEQGKERRQTREAHRLTALVLAHRKSETAVGGLCTGSLHGVCSLTKTNLPLYIFHYVTHNEHSYEGVGAVFKLS
jgi:hypothetical protein